MRNTCVYLQESTRTILLVALAFVFTSSLAAQQDLQIMVSGPWAYVVDPHPENHKPAQRRIVLVALAGSGANMYHHVYVFEDDNAASFRSQPNTEKAPGLYYLDIDPSVRTFAGTRSTNDPNPAPYDAPQDISLGRINTILYTPQDPRYAISLPAPDYYTTYKGEYGDGLSQSKVDVNHVTPKTPSGKYTTWMVLHYQALRANVSASLTDPAGNVTPYAFKGKDSLGVSIVMGVPGMSSETNCDSLSSDSFTQAKHLWNLPIYGRFPSETDGLSGIQNEDDFHYDCKEAGTSGIAAAQDKFKKAQADSDRILNIITGLISQLARPINLHQAKADVQSIREELDGLYFGPVPKDLTQKVDCVDEFVNNKPRSSCPAATTEQVETYLEDIGGTIRRRAAGGTDCHTMQININHAIQ